MTAFSQLCDSECVPPMNQISCNMSCSQRAQNTLMPFSVLSFFSDLKQNTSGCCGDFTTEGTSHQTTTEEQSRTATNSGPLQTGCRAQTPTSTRPLHLVLSEHFNMKVIWMCGRKELLKSWTLRCKALIDTSI